MSAMKYEIHKCTINHLKMKGSKNEAAEDVDFQELDLGDFKTVDSIGDVDGEEGKLFASVLRNLNKIIFLGY